MWWKGIVDWLLIAKDQCRCFGADSSLVPPRVTEFSRWTKLEKDRWRVLEIVELPKAVTGHDSFRRATLISAKGPTNALLYLTCICFSLVLSRLGCIISCTSTLSSRRPAHRMSPRRSTSQYCQVSTDSCRHYFLSLMLLLCEKNNVIPEKCCRHSRTA